MDKTKQLVDTIIEGIKEKKGHAITVADLRGIDGAVTSYFVICQGNSPTQVEAIAESVGDTARIKLGEKPTHVVGLGTNQWVALDYTDAMVHIFLPETRSFYALESLWADAPLTNIPDED